MSSRRRDAYGVLDPLSPSLTDAQAAREWNVGGNECIDFTSARGEIIPEHGHPAIASDVQEQRTLDVHYGEDDELKVQWVELSRQVMPAAERLRGSLKAMSDEGSVPMKFPL